MASGKDQSKRRRSSSTSSVSDDGQESMPRGDGSTPPAKEYASGKPVANACVKCRQRKTKCNGQRPKCQNCIHTPDDCVYPIKLKPGQRAGQGSGTSRRINELERQCQRYEQLFSNLENRFGPDVMRKMQNDHSSSPVIPRHDSLSTHVSAFDTTGLESTSYPHPTLVPDTVDPFANSMPGSRDSFPSIFPEFPTPAVDPHAKLFTWSPGSFPDPDVLPSADIVRDLIDLYWANIHPWAPILGPTHVSPTQIRQKRANPNNVASECRITMDAPWDIVVHAIVVITLRYSNDPRLEGKKDHYRISAKQAVINHAIESTSMESLQALALLAIDLVGNQQNPSSWGILALLTRSAVHMGLAIESGQNAMDHHNRHQAPSMPAFSRANIIGVPADWHEDEARRRLWWLIFVLDRCACVSTGWEFAFSIYDIKRKVPCADVLWTQAQHSWFSTPYFISITHLEGPHPNAEDLHPMSYLVEIVDLLGRAQMLQIQAIDPADPHGVEMRKDATRALMAAAQRWFSGMPLQHQDSPMGLLVRTLHHAAIVKLTSWYAFPAVNSGESVEPFYSTCMAATHHIANICLQLQDETKLKSSCPLACWAFWSAARVLFIDAYTHHRAPATDFEAIVGALKRQARHWTAAEKYVALLETAKRNWASTLSLGPEHSLNNTGAHLSQDIRDLVDIRNTALAAVVGGSQANTNGADKPINLASTYPALDASLGQLPVWAVQPMLGDLHSWFDMPTGLFGVE